MNKKIINLLCAIGILFTTQCKGHQQNDLIGVWLENKWPPKEMEAPEGLTITPYEAFIIIAKEKKLSVKHIWHMYTDGKIYYIFDTFGKTSTSNNALKYAIKVNGLTGQIKNQSGTHPD